MSLSSCAAAMLVTAPFFSLPPLSSGSRARKANLWFAGAETGRVLFMYTPGRAGKLFEEMAERPVDPMNQQEFGAVAERHGWEIVGQPPF